MGPEPQPGEAQQAAGLASGGGDPRFTAVDKLPHPAGWPGAEGWSSWNQVVEQARLAMAVLRRPPPLSPVAGRRHPETFRGPLPRYGWAYQAKRSQMNKRKDLRP